MNPLRVISGQERWCVVHGDSRKVLPYLPERGVNHVITDPPYSRDLYARTRTNKGRGVRPSGTPYAKSELTPSTSALQLKSLRIGAVEDVLSVAPELLRVVSRWLVVFHDCETTEWRTLFGDTYKRTGAWVKTDPMPQISGDRPGQGFEPCTIAHAPGRMRWNGGGKAAVWRHGTAKGKDRPNHPCPKPLSLMRELIEQFTDPDDVVLDPFCGSGSTGVACVQLGRRFIGVELDRTFASVARRRIKAALSGRPERRAA